MSWINSLFFRSNGVTIILDFVNEEFKVCDLNCYFVSYDLVKILSTWSTCCTFQFEKMIVP